MILSIATAAAQPAAAAPPPPMIDQIVITFELFKQDMVTRTGLADDALHVYFGIACMLLVRLCWRWRGGWIIAWLVTLAMAQGGEWLDARSNSIAGAVSDGADHWHDLWNTMVAPTMLLIAGPWLNPRRKPNPDSEHESEPDSAEVQQSGADSGDHPQQPLEQA